MNINGHELRDTLTKGETLTVEFKSDRKPLPDRELVAAIVALQYQDSAGLAALIANKTNPSITNSRAC
jgi:ATP-dependent DNA helicase RecG